MTLQDVIAKFNTIPFLFAGAGITRRYYGLPGWEGLLKTLAERINPDRYTYQAYKSRAERMDCPNGVLPMAASLIQNDFDEAWYVRADMRQLDERGLDLVENGLSPFKAELATLIARTSDNRPEYAEEIRKLKQISRKNLAGIITTNYDLFFEKLFEDYKSYVGQDELLFSPIQGIAEIYKIHGSVSNPETIVVNNADYQAFNDKCKYLAAKLMTIFMEYPIMFIGYSLADQNIRNILNDIVACLPSNQFDKLQERFVFVEYRKGVQNAVVSKHSIDLGGRLLNMTQVTTDNYGLVFDTLAVKKAKIPVKLLRQFKEEIYTYVITSQPGPLMQVAELEDSNIDENRLCVSIGTTRGTSEYGLKSIIDANSWYKDIITGELDEMGFTPKQRLDLAFASVFKGQNGCLPVHKYLSQADGDYPLVRAHAAASFEDLISTTIRNCRKYVAQYTSVCDLWKTESKDRIKAVRLLSWLPEEKLHIEELYSVLHEIITTEDDALQTKGFSTDLKRLIRIYDYLRWGKKKTSPTSAH